MTRHFYSDKPNIPKGVATLLPDDAYIHRYIERKFLESFSSWGYQEIITPIFEYLDVILNALDTNAVEASYQFPDRSSGRMMVLRTDVTPQIARIASQLLFEHQPPLRLCYSANVFRHQSDYLGRERETFQIGSELIGLNTPEADAELIELGIKTLMSVGINDFRIALGHVGFLNSILELDSFASDKKNLVIEIFMKRDISLLENNDLLSPQEQLKIRKLLEITGESDQLAKAEAMVENKEQNDCLQRLADIVSALSDYNDKIIIDIAEIRGLNYYTGVIFEYFCSNSGAELGAGGRYDKLLEKFGNASPSCGFSFDLERVQKVMEKAKTTPERSTADLLFVYPAKQKSGVEILRRIRNSGLRVIQIPSEGDILKETLQQSALYNQMSILAEDQGIKSIVFHTSKGELFQLKEKMFGDIDIDTLLS